MMGMVRARARAAIGKRRAASQAPRRAGAPAAAAARSDRRRGSRSTGRGGGPGGRRARPGIAARPFASPRRADLLGPPPPQQPQIILLREGTDTSQGVPQLVSNINACVALADTVRTTLGPRGCDKLIHDDRGGVTISNDGATIMKLLEVVHPAAKTLVDVSLSQDAEVGDGTTTVVLLAGELLRAVKPFVEEGVHPQAVARAVREAGRLAVAKVRELAVPIGARGTPGARDALVKCAGTSLNSKLVCGERDFFAAMVVDAVLALDAGSLDLAMLGVKKVQGGGLRDSFLVDGVAFKKTFAYAGFEMQPKQVGRGGGGGGERPRERRARNEEEKTESRPRPPLSHPPPSRQVESPKILCLNVELELKSEKDNAEVRLADPGDYQAVVDAEWNIIYAKLQVGGRRGERERQGAGGFFFDLPPLPLRPAPTPAPPSSSPAWPLATWRRSGLRTGTLCAPAASPRTTWRACSRRPARPSRRRPAA